MKRAKKVLRKSKELQAIIQFPQMCCCIGTESVVNFCSLRFLSVLEQNHMKPDRSIFGQEERGEIFRIFYFETFCVVFCDSSKDFFDRFLSNVEDEYSSEICFCWDYLSRKCDIFLSNFSKSNITSYGCIQENSRTKNDILSFKYSNWISSNLHKIT